MYILNPKVKFRIEKNEIFICDCKRLIDLKVGIEYLDTLNRLNKGLEIKDKILLNEMKNMKLISDLVFRKIEKNEFETSFKLMKDNLKLFRTKSFLKSKYQKYPDYFIGAFIDNKLIGAIYGFPREDYLLLSEIAVESPFRKRDIGRRLVERFEKIAKKKYSKIKLGSKDDSILFYKHLSFKKAIFIGKGKTNLELNVPILSENYIKDLKKLNPDKKIQAVFWKDKNAI